MPSKADFESWWERFFGKKIRFKIVDNEGASRSADWFVREASDSIYVSASALGGLIKFSLHPRGTSKDGNDTQYGTTKSYFKRVTTKGLQPLGPYFRWQRPIGKNGQFKTVLAIAFPTNGLRRVDASKQGTRGKKFLAFDLAPAGKAVEVSLLSSAFDPLPFERDLRRIGVTPMVGFELPGNEWITLAARQVDFDDSLLRFENDKGHVLWNQDIPADLKIIDEASAVAILKKPMDGEPLRLIEMTGLTVTRA